MAETPPSTHTWRPLAAADAAALAALEAACAPVDENTELKGTAGYAARLAQAGPHLQQDTLAACDPAGELVAYAWATFNGEFAAGRRVLLDTLVHPAQRGRGLEDYLLDWLAARGERIAAETHDERPCVLRIEVYHRNESLMAQYEQHGFAFAFSEEEMQRDLSLPVPDCPLPAGLRFVPWNDAMAGEFYAVYADAFRTRPGFTPPDATRWRQTYTGHADFRPDLSLLASDGTQGAAYAVCWVEDQVGWIVQMGVRIARRRQGLGRALLAEAMRGFRAHGLARAALEVNVNNPEARQLYESLGFAATKRYSVFNRSVS